MWHYIKNGINWLLFCFFFSILFIAVFSDFTWNRFFAVIIFGIFVIILGALNQKYGNFLGIKER